MSTVTVHVADTAGPTDPDPDLDARRAAVDELGAARDELARLPRDCDGMIDRDDVLARLRGRVDALTPGGDRA